METPVDIFNFAASDFARGEDFKTCYMNLVLLVFIRKNTRTAGCSSGSSLLCNIKSFIIRKFERLEEAMTVSNSKLRDEIVSSRNFSVDTLELERLRN